MVPGGYSRVGTGWVIPGTQPAAKDGHPQGNPDSGAGPVGPAGAGVGGQGYRPRWTVPVRPPIPLPTLASQGPVGPLQGPPWYRTLAMSASGPIRARIDLISCNISQNDEVSPKSVEKASISPYFQTGLKSHLLIY